MGLTERVGLHLLVGKFRVKHCEYLNNTINLSFNLYGFNHCSMKFDANGSRDEKAFPIGKVKTKYLGDLCLNRSVFSPDC